MNRINQFMYSRERRRFGREPHLVDRTQLMLSIAPSFRLRMSYILRNPIDMETQLSDQKAASEMLTLNVPFADHGVFHYEGGWPKEVNINDEEQTLRYRKKIEREDTWGPQVTDLIHRAVVLTSQNAAINIYQHFFQDLPKDLGGDIRANFEARLANVFHDPAQPHRTITVIDWTPSADRRFLVAHGEPKQKTPKSTEDEKDWKEERPASYGGSVTTIGTVGAVTAFAGEIERSEDDENTFYTWDMNNPLKPVQTFKCEETIRKVLYCPKDDIYIAGGVSSGKVVVWDARAGGMPLRVCPFEAAHREAASAICWVHSKTNTEFYTGSEDGTIKYWDGRDLTVPSMEILLDPVAVDEQKRENAHGCSALEFEYTIPVRFIAASDMGHIFIGNRKGATALESLVSNFKLFAGPIRTVERNPFFVKNFLIVGDWCAKIWAEEFKGAPTTLIFKKKNEMLCGTWSTSRCSLFATGDAAGELDFWDLLLHQRKPIFTIKFRNGGITQVKFRADGEYLAVSLDNGDVHMLELDDAMKKSQSKDRAYIAALFERELVRCKLLEGRVEEMKLKRVTSIMEAEKREREEEARRRAEAEAAGADPNELLLQQVDDDPEYKLALAVFNEIIYRVIKRRQEREFMFERTEFEYEDEISPFASTDDFSEPNPTDA